MHSICLLLFTVGYITSRDPNRGFLWLVPYFGDMPSSLISEHLIHDSPSLTPRVAVYLLLGGVQWLIVGILLDLLLGTKPPSAHASPDI